MKTQTIPKTVYLKDYKPFPFKIDHLDLDFDIYDGYTRVTSKSTYTRLDPDQQELVLDGEDMEILSVTVNSIEHEHYVWDDHTMRITDLPDYFELTIITKIFPEKNTYLEGLYNSGGTYCTQCEAEGFRRITYYPDRPDVLTTFTVRIEADKKHPVLLSNGNLIDSGSAGESRHYTIWEDPFPKPCYLFALVAGDLTRIHDTFTTRSGREVDLYIYVRPGDEDQCAHAMESLKNSMKWDEDVYGLEYDLDIFNIVAVSDFNMGAMENKSLNIFNTALVLAHQETATDSDFMRVEGVIAHEYFHNWSGNRVTCRDWFQLSLKEGLTVFRDQAFTADMHSHDVKRIDDVTHLRRFQFTEDASPLAHPIRPDNYIEINNFYTMTVYEKGAEVIRMMHTLLGAENYRKGAELYFKRHDGQAVTCEDFVQAMQDASGVNLDQFKRWYEQAGTPNVTFTGSYDETARRYDIILSQELPDTPGQTNKKPMVIPVSLGLISPQGEDLIGTQTLVLDQSKKTFSFDNIEERPVPSVLRNFSAPVKLNTDLSDEDYIFLMKNEIYDGFNRWESGQYLACRALNKMLDQYEQGNNTSPELPATFIESFDFILSDALKDNADKAFLARAMTPPAIGVIAQDRKDADPENIHKVRNLALRALKNAHHDKLMQIYEANTPQGSFSISSQEMARRALRNAALALLTITGSEKDAQLAKEHYNSADNMTDRVAALSCLTNFEHALKDEAFADLYERYQDVPLVIDKWFALQAISTLPETISKLEELRQHKDFTLKNPNRVRALYAAFAMNNPSRFHAKDGSGYAFLRDAVIELNAINPQIGARLLTPMREWQKYTPVHQKMIRKALQDILKIKDISPNIYEIASKSLGE
ncbi:MAG: aminopeptidase N [Alphaproteobacteria bacterium]